MASPQSSGTSPAPPASAPESGAPAPPRPRGARRPEDRRFRLLSLLPLVAFLLIFAAYPLVQLVQMSFAEVNIRGGEFVSRFA